MPQRFEQAFANSLVFGRNGDSFWIGLSDQGSPNSFHWLSGEDVSYTNWNRDQPGGSGGSGRSSDAEPDHAVLMPKHNDISKMISHNI